jgi:MFS family permease
VNRSGRLRPAAVIGVSLGNALAFYDFLIFGIFAVQISKVIYPPAAGITQLLLALGTFGVGFITRPLGAWVIGRIGDRRGRKPAMLISFTLAGVAVLGQALVPPYALIGLAAPIMMLLFRLLLGFAIGGEVGPSTSYLIEAAPEKRRGLFVSLQFATQDMAALVAGIVGFLLARNLSDQALTEWGWRVAMLVGVSIVPFGLYLRSRLEETLEADDAPAPSAGGERATRIAALGFFIIVSATVGSYGLSYLTVHAQTTLGMATELAFQGTIFFGFAAVLFDIVGGTASDRFGRKPVMLFGVLALAATLIPAFFWLNASPTILVLVLVSFWLSMLNALGPAAALVGVTEALPARSRSAALGITYSLAVAVFGGTTQFVIAWLTDTLKDPLAPAYYVLAILLVGVAAMLAFPETAPARLARKQPRSLRVAAEP